MFNPSGSSDCDVDLENPFALINTGGLFARVFRTWPDNEV